DWSSDVCSSDLECGGNQGGPVVGSMPAFATDQGHADSHESRARRYGIGAMVPCISFHGSAPEFLTNLAHPPEKNFLDDDYSNEHREREGSRRFVRRADLLYREYRYTDSGTHKQ